MHASVRRYRTSDVDALTRKVEDEFIEQVKGVEGFLGYYVIDGREGDVAAVTVCQTADALREITKLAGEWVSESVADLVEGPPEVILGEVVAHAERDASEESESSS